jgi:hypothetical protein
MGPELQTGDNEDIYEAPTVTREGTLLDLTGGGGTHSGPPAPPPHIRFPF